MADANWTDQRQDVAYALTYRFPEHFRLWKSESKDYLQAKFEAPHPTGWDYLWLPFGCLDAVVEDQPHPVPPFAFEQILAPLLRAASHHGITVHLESAFPGAQVSVRLSGPTRTHQSTGSYPGELLAYALVAFVEASHA